MAGRADEWLSGAKRAAERLGGRPGARAAKRVDWRASERASEQATRRLGKGGTATEPGKLAASQAVLDAGKHPLVSRRDRPSGILVHN